MFSARAVRVCVHPFRLRNLDQAERAEGFHLHFDRTSLVVADAFEVLPGS